MNNIREVQRVKSDIYPDKIIVYYFSGRKREYFEPLPKTVKEFIADNEPVYEAHGDYYRYMRRNNYV